MIHLSIQNHLITLTKSDARDLSKLLIAELNNPEKLGRFSSPHCGEVMIYTRNKQQTAQSFSEKNLDMTNC